ncbi:MAG: hypothetical protein ACI83D_000509 [Planctomycetota bacterium]|jgi:hypothetical protein
MMTFSWALFSAYGWYRQKKFNEKIVPLWITILASMLVLISIATTTDIMFLIINIHDPSFPPIAKRIMSFLFIGNWVLFSLVMLFYEGSKKYYNFLRTLVLLDKLMASLILPSLFYNMPNDLDLLGGMLIAGFFVFTAASIISHTDIRSLKKMQSPGYIWVFNARANIPCSIALFGSLIYYAIFC